MYGHSTLWGGEGGVHLDNKIKHINPLVVCCVLCVVVCGVWCVLRVYVLCVMCYVLVVCLRRSPSAARVLADSPEGLLPPLAAAARAQRAPTKASAQA